MILVGIILLSVTAALAWWLSGYHSKLTGESRREDLIHRIVRCGVTLVLAGILLWLPATPAVLPILLVFAAAFFLLWRNCIGELSAHLFQKLIDPEDKRQFDPKQSMRQLDLIGALVRNGKKGRGHPVVRIAQTLWRGGSHHAGIDAGTSGCPAGRREKTSPLTKAGQLRRQGKFNEAGLLLNSLLAENPRNVDAAMMLVRLHAQDLREPHKAHDVLRALEQQPHIPASHIEFARRSIVEWS